MKRIPKMLNSRIIFFLIVIVVFTPASIVFSSITIYDSKGFEESMFNLGSLNGQEGWSGSFGSGGTIPTVVSPPQPVIGQQAVCLRVSNAYFDFSEMRIDLDRIVASNFKQITISFDIYRTTTNHNLWFGIDLGGAPGTPSFGIQWDVDTPHQVAMTHPFGWLDGAQSVPTLTDDFVNLTITWDFQNSKAQSWYNGFEVDDGFPINDINEIFGFYILLRHDSPNLIGGSDVAYIDNFIITGIPYHTIEVPLDIKPNSYPNSINLKSKGKIPVAILTTDDFDASDVEPASCEFAGADPIRWNVYDLDNDGDDDMILHFNIQKLAALNKNSTEASLECETYGGETIIGTDTVNIVPKGKSHYKSGKKYAKKVKKVKMKHKKGK